MNAFGIITIERGSEAWAIMSNAVLTGDTFRISAVNESEVKVKINEGMWTPPIKATI